MVPSSKASAELRRVSTSGGAGGWKALAPPTSASAPTATRRLLAQSVHEAITPSTPENRGL
jgi:hypothetical protein